MNTIALTHILFLKTLFAVLRRRTVGGHKSIPPIQKAPAATAAIAPKNRVGRAIDTGTHPHLAAKTPAVRIVRVIEHPQSCQAVGRMVISGRMADVCAELDRLAACEAAC